MKPVPLLEVARHITRRSEQPDDGIRYSIGAPRQEPLAMYKKHAGSAPPHEKNLMAIYGDILIPGMRSGKGIDQIRTTEKPVPYDKYHILRPKPEHLDPRYLFWFLRSPLFEQKKFQILKEKNFFPVSILKSIEIPMPDTVTEQKRIASILDMSDRIQNQSRRILSLINDLIRSLYIKKFRHPLDPKQKFPKKTLSQLAQIDTGKMHPSAVSKRCDSDIPYITPDDLGEVISSTKKYIGKKYASEARLINPEATVICGFASVGKMGFVTNRSAVGRNIHAVTWNDEIDPVFGYIGLSLYSEYISELGSPASGRVPIAGRNLIANLDFAVPPLEQQKEFSSLVNEIWMTKSRLNDQYCQSDNCERKLSHQAFGGQL